VHIPTHILSGWCAADLVELTPRERVFAMVAAAIPDVDGLGLLLSFDYYNEYHHVLAHNLLFGTVSAGLLALCSTHRLKGFILYFALFHLHLVMDLLGSGPAWGIRYFWPVSSHDFQNPYGWELSSWQNTLALAILLAWTVASARKRGRTPFELLYPSLDREFRGIPRVRSGDLVSGNEPNPKQKTKAGG